MRNSFEKAKTFLFHSVVSFIAFAPRPPSRESSHYFLQEVVSIPSAAKVASNSVKLLEMKIYVGPI